MNAAAHPNSQDGKIGLGDLIVSIRDGRTATCQRSQHSYHIRGLRGDGFDAICINRSGGFCWHREITERHARNIIKNTIELDGAVSVGKYADEWPSRFQGGDRR